MRSIKGTTAPSGECEWCGSPATTTIVVEPIRLKKLAGGRTQILDLPVHASVCAAHAEIGSREGLTPDAVGRRQARGVEQLDLLDTTTGPADAIRGIDT